MALLMQTLDQIKFFEDIKNNRGVGFSEKSAASLMVSRLLMLEKIHKCILL